MMVSPYYVILLKLLQKVRHQKTKRSNFDYLSKFHKSPRKSNNSKVRTCRICLNTGIIPIYKNDNSNDLSAAVSTFGNICVSADDEYPKYLCDCCHKLLSNAILFRKTAQLSDKLLKSTEIKFEIENSINDFNFSDNEIDRDEKIPSIDTEDTGKNGKNIWSEKNKKAQNSSFKLNSKPVKEKKIVNPITAQIAQFFTVVKDNEQNQNVKVKKRKVIRVQCKICHKIMAKASYRDHYALHDPSLPKYVCEFCGKMFRQQSALKNHIYIHSTEFKFKCKLCPYKGRHSEHLKIHLRTHTGDYRYLCSECPARFLVKSNLNKHLLKHKEPMYKCDHCKQRFRSKIVLERHIEAIHLGLKNHICNLCGQAFGYRKRLRQHELKIHKREKMRSGRMPAYLAEAASTLLNEEKTVLSSYH